MSNAQIARIGAGIYWCGRLGLPRPNRGAGKSEAPAPWGGEAWSGGAGLNSPGDCSKCRTHNSRELGRGYIGVVDWDCRARTEGREKAKRPPLWGGSGAAKSLGFGIYSNIILRGSNSRFPEII